MSEMRTGRLVSSRSLKLAAGGVSLIALALLAMLAVGVFSNDPVPTNPKPVVSISAPTPKSAVAPPTGSPALHAAIAKNDSELVQIIVEGGADVDAKNRFGDPALHEAIAGGDRGMVEILVGAGSNVDAKNTFGDPALHLAIQEGDADLVRILVEAGANVNITNAFGDSALSRAVHEGNKEMAKILAGAGGS